MSHLALLRASSGSQGLAQRWPATCGPLVERRVCCLHTACKMRGSGGATQRRHASIGPMEAHQKVNSVPPQNTSGSQEAGHYGGGLTQEVH